MTRKKVKSITPQINVLTDIWIEEATEIEYEDYKQLETAKAYKLNPLVKVSAHPSSCPLCSPWQGRVLVDDVYQGGIADGKHELLSTAIGAGLGHYNCRHNWVNYVEGLDKPNIFRARQTKQTKDCTELCNGTKTARNRKKYKKI